MELHLHSAICFHGTALGYVITISTSVILPSCEYRLEDSPLEPTCYVLYRKVRVYERNEGKVHPFLLSPKVEVNVRYKMFLFPTRIDSDKL
jgi:hypothetical protein